MTRSHRLLPFVSSTLDVVLSDLGECPLGSWRSAPTGCATAIDRLGRALR